jgi:hypothetical protein
MTVAERRTPRFRPVSGRAFRATERDGWLLESLGKMRFMRTGQVAQLGFEGSRWAAHKRLRKLLDANLVKVWVGNLADENIYSLTPRGARLAAGEDGLEYAQVPRGLDGNLNHLLGINDVRLSVALGLAAEGHELLWWRSDWELRSGVRGAAVPDALFSIEIGGPPRQFALEVEHAGRSPRKFIAKILRYRSLGPRLTALYGVNDLGVLVVGRDDRSTERTRQSLRALPALRIWFSSLTDIRDRGAIGPIWQDIHGHERHSLRAL